MTEHQKHRALLKEWSLVNVGPHHIIVGYIYGDVKKEFKDGWLVRSSAVKRIDFTTGRVETQNSVYLVCGGPV